MRKTYSILSAAFIAFASVSLCGSCSSSDDTTETNKSSYAKQRLEILLSGDKDRFEYVLTFWGNDREGKASAMTTSDGTTASSYWSILSADTAFTKAWASVDGYGKTVSASFTVSNPYGNDGTVTITARVHNDNNVILEQSRKITVDAGTDGASITFTPEYGFSNID